MKKAVIIVFLVLFGCFCLVSLASAGDESTKAYLGVEFYQLPQATAEQCGFPPGACIVQVDPGSPAEIAGIYSGDVIIKIDGRDCSNLLNEIKKKKPGDVAIIEVWRHGRTFTLSITLAKHPESTQ